ncbi:hypothetical protein ACFLYR_07340 [Chloroflexota bacterium]
MTSLASQAMELAADYRAEGYDPSEALSLAWDEVRDESNPVEDLIDNPWAKWFMLTGFGYLAWCFWAKTRSGSWSWTPWNIAAPSRRLAQGTHTRLPQTAAQSGQRPYPTQTPAPGQSRLAMEQRFGGTTKPGFEEVRIW